MAFGSEITKCKYTAMRYFAVYLPFEWHGHLGSIFSTNNSFCDKINAS